ncbi:Phd_YefM [Caballeronia calidae]|uniref:Phd_YefM n=1 Tax=Caballeronia calidae TaxID=1777139 RepID=A0A158EE84_9BURK|nr:type II toxin-antitoxin system Phd/YefM family antitoxin [Caballeronia calidae]SAL05124.1 Phd_YefM [Caballeronia calidae]
MHTVSLHEAKANLDQLLTQALAGETIYIDDDNGPVYTISCVGTHKGVRFGLLKDELGDISDIEAALAAPLPAEVLAAFEAR